MEALPEIMISMRQRNGEIKKEIVWPGSSLWHISAYHGGDGKNGGVLWVAC